MLERKQLKNRAQVTFILPEDTPDGPVSVVGDFNHWNPAAHPLRGQFSAAARSSTAYPVLAGRQIPTVPRAGRLSSAARIRSAAR
ncbi:hypothetical protein [Streptomyces sp. NPDC002082]|uniref:hypothetical protein n=1 Tax=Streptomyces sp. NPDC002082 TaxID=3154772 RepID=UPI0033268988